MTRPRVFVLDVFHEAGMELIARHADVVRWDDPRVGAWREEADGLVTANAAQVAHQRFACLSGTKDQHAFGGFVGTQQALILPCTEDQTWRTQQHGECEGVQQ